MFYSVFPFEGFLGVVFLSLFNSFVDLNLIRHAGSRGRTGLTLGSAFFAIVFYFEVSTFSEESVK
jgi:hypothetical protein